VRVVTPAFVFDEAGLDGSKNSFLCALSRTEAEFGVAALDLSTGELLACAVVDESAALAEIARLDPREVLVGPGLDALVQQVKRARPRLAVRTDADALSPKQATRVIDELLGASALAEAALGPAATEAAARCVQFARQCEPSKPLPIRRIHAYSVKDTLVLDESTQGHLELVRANDGETRGALLSHIDLTQTATGARLLRRRLLAPLTRVADIRRLHDAVELFVTQPELRRNARQLLGRVADLERLAVKLATGRVAPRDLGSLRNSLTQVPSLAKLIAQCTDPFARELPSVAGDAACDDLGQLLGRALSEELPVKLSDGAVIAPGFDAELDAARDLATHGQDRIASLEARLREASGISTLKLRYTRVFGWYMEVTRSQAAKTPKEWRRKQTVANGERYTCDELDELADALAHAEDRRGVREAELFAQLCVTLATHTERLHALARALSEIDVAAALGELAQTQNLCRPEVDDSLVLDMEDCRHLVVEKLASAGNFVPNDVQLDADPHAGAAAGSHGRLWLITGPNMSGKSTFMRQVAQAVILAQMGSFVPARRARIGVVDRVLTRVGATDNLSRGESTFMVEMKETANVLRRATARSLVVLDEIGRGTSTYDGLSIAWAVAEYLHDVVCARALFATHYHELTKIVADAPSARNLSVAAREHDGDIVFFHRVEPGAASRSYGVACARLAGLPEPVLARARAILESLESAPVALEPTRGARKVPPQLSLFEAPAAAPAADHPALRTLRAVEPDRMTPLEALSMIATLKKLAEP
jgi:DNA mismatch repair protein MutS